MSSDLDFLSVSRLPTSERPLAGMHILVVEDSRFACEALRLLCLRSGARIRRADSLRAARRHLSAYRPGILIVDLGLPDGSGLDLIREATQGTTPVEVVIAISGDPAGEAGALAAGAQVFAAKPLTSLEEFQSLILAHLPEGSVPQIASRGAGETVEPDMLAFQDDMARVAEALNGAGQGEDLAYVAQFLSGVARTAGDSALQQAAEALETHRSLGQPIQSDIARVAGLVQDRLATRRVV